MSVGSADISVGSPRPPSRIRKLLRPSSDVVIIAGAGVSAGCGLPTGKELAEWLRGQQFAEGIDFPVALGALIDHPGAVAGAIADSDLRGDTRSVLLHAVDAHITALQEAAPAELSPAMRAVARAPSGLVLTLNYDTLIERAAELDGRPCKSFGPNDLRQLVSDGIYPDDGGLYVVHLHGIIGDPQGFVLDPQSYAERVGLPAVQSLFAGVVANRRNFCAIGTDFAEDYLATVALGLRPRTARHVVVGETSLSERMARGETFLNPRRHQWDVCQFANRDYGVLDPFCEWLVEKPDHGSGHPPLPPSEPDPGPTSKYAARRLTPQDGPGAERGLFDDRSVPEDALLGEQRSIIIGVAGGGKSRLLSSLAELDDGPTAVVAIKSIRESLGEPQGLLQAWLEGAHAASDHPISAADVVAGDVRAWIQLDGLDEADLAIRSEIADAIMRIADAYPQHRFTVTTRPNSVEARFGDAWSRFDLVSDQHWQTEYLAENEVDPKAFWGSMAEGGQRLREVLQVAFFLQAAVTLWREGGPVRSPRQIALDLLDRALAADEQLRPIGSRTRGWLRRVALSQQLGDSLAISESRLVLLAETEDLGDPVRVADLLARRSLLALAAESWTFSHRLFGEALVAEQLLEEQPSGWLDCVAPVRDGRSRVLDRWAAPLAMVLEESPGWREAVAKRDPVFAARATPISASAEERESAGLLLWRRAAETDTWIDPLTTPQSGLGATDSAVVAQFLAADEVPQLEDEVRQGLQSDSRFVRGNAIDVLAAVPVGDIVEILRRALAEDVDFVVRRSAASAAGRLAADELLPLVAERARHFEDDSEAHDMASVALRLSPSSDRLRLALELLENRNGYLKYYRLPSEHPADERLQWVEAQHEVSGDYAGHSIEREIREILDEGAEQLSDEASERIGYLTATARIHEQSIVDFTVTNEFAVRGVVRAFKQHETLIYARGTWLLRLIDPELLARAGAPRELVFRVKEWGPPPAESEAPPRPATNDQAARRADKEAAIRSALELSGDDRRARLAGLASIDRGDLGDLDESLKTELADTLDQWWGDADLAGAVKLVERRANIKTWATVVLTFGPPLRMPLTDARWVQVATCGFIFDAQMVWLRAQLTDGRLAAALATTPSARALVDLLQIGNEGDVHAVLAAIAERPFADFDQGDVRDVTEVLAENDAIDFMAMLLESDSGWNGPLDPVLASKGDVDAQRRELERTAAALDADKLGDFNWDSNWIGEINDPALIPELSRALYAAARVRRPDDPHDLVPALVSALGRIGNEDALRVIERFIAARPYPGAQFLVHEFGGIVQQILEPLSVAEARRIAGERGLPID